mgnify:CR=1 FL=1
MIIRVFIFCFMSFFGFSQVDTTWFDYKSGYLSWPGNSFGVFISDQNKGLSDHTSLKPLDGYRGFNLVDKSVRYSLPKYKLSGTDWTLHKNLSKRDNEDNLELEITPIMDLGGQYVEGVYGYRIGAGLMTEAYLKNKFYGRVIFCPTITSGFNPLEYFDSNSLTVKNRMVYTTRARLCYKPNEVFSFHAGLDNNFIGEGSRSLFLSDYGRPSPFAQMRSKFWRIQYMVQYNFLREKEQDDWKSKYMASHHISWNITKWLNLGIFEAVVFKPRDTLLNRGFDVEYLNPMVFFRPQEYSLGSSDNVLLGLSLSGKIKSHTIYSQLILDEFLLSEIKNQTGWWANKYGAQLGIKGRFKIKKESFFYRAETNLVRPYTYAHLDNSQNYGHQNTVLAHPHQSNFYEFLAELRWRKSRWNARLFAMYMVKGGNVNEQNFGGNIYDSYVNRPNDYGNYIGQGRSLNTSMLWGQLTYELFPKWSTCIYADAQIRKEANNPANLIFMGTLGIRSWLWNDYRNY